MANVQDTHVDLDALDHVPSSTSRRLGGFSIPTLTKVLVGVVVITVMPITGVLIAVLLTLNTSKETSTASSTKIISSTTVTKSTTTTPTTTTATTTTTAATATSVTTTSTTTTTVTTAPRRVFALSQVINGQTVTCSSVVNTNSSFTECDDLQEGGLYAPNGVTCTNAWSTTPPAYWAAVAFCQAFLNSSNTYIEAFYDCNASQTRFTWSDGVWGTTTDNGYTKDLRCFY